ncbi:hypothetical protein JKG47_14835 [Acidithiobacillus sp. MC6.1]|nr:hypothetical protein [Acidithiobacillus sp. MC6.1]
MVDDIVGIKFQSESPLLDWERIHDEWIRNLDEFSRITDGAEIPYVHAEHPNNTQFVISASKAGYAAMREMLGGSRGGDATARLDICLVSDKTVDLVEAKFVEFNFDNPSRQRLIADHLKQATSQVRQYTNRKSQLLSSGKTVRRVAVSFITPFIENQEPLDDKKLQGLLSEIDESQLPDMLSWVFAARMRKFSYWGRVYPGVIMVAKMTNADTDSPT